MEKTRIPLAEARDIAGRFIDLVSGTAVRVEIAGSIRRQLMYCGDIEICLIPIEARVPDPADLFEERHVTVNRHFEKMQKLLGQEAFDHRRDVNGRTCFGPSYQRIVFEGFALDCFCCDKDQWGLHMAVRTGPAELSKRLMMQRQHGGLLPEGHNCSGFRLIRYGRPVETPEEGDVWAAIGLNYVQPHQRDEWASQRFGRREMAAAGAR